MSFLTTVFDLYLRMALRPIVFFLLFLIGKKSKSDFFDAHELSLNTQIPSIFKTLYINFRCLPFSQAKKLPIYAFKKVSIAHLSGKIRINGQLSSGMIKIGRDWGWRCKGDTRIRIEGEITFKGKCEILRGAEICVFKSGLLYIGNNVLLAENTSVFCMEKIIIGDSTRITYESQIFDTDFHYTINIDKREIKRRTAPIIIGEHVWIGNRATIKKGTTLPDYTTIAAAGTLLIKDYTEAAGKFGCLGGCPAKVLPVKSSRIWNNELERSKTLDLWFKEHPEAKIYKLAEEESIDNYIGIKID